MAHIRIARAAATDIETILLRSEAEFGYQARERYDRLIVSALTLLADRQAPEGQREDLERPVHIFHLALARRRARISGPTVVRPRHFLVWRFTVGDAIEVVRVLHDAMDLERHLPPDDEPKG